MFWRLASQFAVSTTSTPGSSRFSKWRRFENREDPGDEVHLQSLRRHRLKGSPEIYLFLVNYALITKACLPLSACASDSNQNRRKIAKPGYQRMPQRTCSKTSQISVLISATQRYPVDKQGIELTCITKLVLESLLKDLFKTRTATGTRMQILMGYFYLI